MVEVVGEAVVGEFLRPVLRDHAVTGEEIDVGGGVERDHVGREASFTARAWALEPPWAWSMRTSLPVVFL